MAPGAAGQILDIINKNIDDEKDPTNAEGLRELAKQFEDMVVVAQNHEARLRKLEGR